MADDVKSMVVYSSTQLREAVENNIEGSSVAVDSKIAQTIEGNASSIVVSVGTASPLTRLKSRAKKNKPSLRAVKKLLVKENASRKESQVLKTKCSPHRFHQNVKLLSEEKREAIKGIGFGGLLCVPDVYIKPRLIKWLVNQYDISSNSFVIRGRRYRITERDVVLILGLRCHGEQPRTSGPNSDIFLDLCKHFRSSPTGSISLYRLEFDLQWYKQLYNDVEHFQRAFILFSICTLLCPTKNSTASASFLHCLVDLEEFPSLAWGRFVLDHLLGCVRYFKTKPLTFMAGCAYLLQVWYFEHILVDMGDEFLMQPIHPRFAKWNDAITNKRTMLELANGGFGMGEIIEVLEPTEEELNEEIVVLVMERENEDEGYADGCDTPLHCPLDSNYVKRDDSRITELEFQVKELQESNRKLEARVRCLEAYCFGSSSSEVPGMALNQDGG